ncbi:hypothetical protein SAMN05661096_00979 [Marivirga sericea]|uniref:Uncharacterized protein n=1 Tax=Marivirga sericea TaxID=1028 RepID=A0A1X7ISB5_9BACT|nr:hypothetical protein [Marivirga sericea]SMG17640.1 hypothetical protein SAMN05661096_00979 [Marivirga sericea]
MIKDKILSYKVRRGQKKNEFLHQAYTYNKLRKVGVIFSFDDLKKHEAVKNFIKTLKEDGIEVTALAYKAKNTQNFEFYFDFFEDKDIGFFGSIDNPYFQSFLNQKLEYLFCLDDSPNLYMQYLLVHSKSDTRIGAYQAEENQASFFELMIKPNKSGDTKILTEEIIHYVRKISGNN